MPTLSTREEALRLNNLISQLSGAYESGPFKPAEEQTTTQSSTTAPFHQQQNMFTGQHQNPFSREPPLGSQATTVEPADMDDLTERMTGVPVFEKKDEVMDGLTWGLGTAQMMKKAKKKEDEDMDEVAYDMMQKWAPDRTAVEYKGERTKQRRGWMEDMERRKK